jgi:hypothetical protein
VLAKIETKCIENNDFKVCKSVHLHTIQINHQIDATISPVYYLTFIYSLTCFERLHAYYLQELNNCSSSLWFYLRSVVIAVLLVVVRPAGRPKVKPEAATAVVELLMIGARTLETC